MTNYNEEQVRAIGKALSSNTITAILGPPGTGKTSVIAEIASQLASRGLRILISSQSNLSVDNALERVLDSDQIFRIRVGRPESVKFNSELLKDRASDRYRRMLLEKSTRAFRELDEELKSTSIKSPKEVELLCSRVRTFVEIRESHKQVSATLAVARKVRDQCKVHLESCESALEQALRTEGLADEDLPNFLDSIAALKRSSMNPMRVFERSDNISLAPNHRQKLHVLQDCMSAEQACEPRVETAARHVGDLNNRISSSDEKRQKLDHQLSHNKRIEQKRLTAGFWGTLGSYLSDIVYDLEPLRREIESLLSPA